MLTQIHSKRLYQLFTRLFSQTKSMAENIFKEFKDKPNATKSGPVTFQSTIIQALG